MELISNLVSNWIDGHLSLLGETFFGIVVISIIIIFISPSRREIRLRRNTKEEPMKVQQHPFSNHCFKIIKIYKDMLYVQIGGADLAFPTIEPKYMFYVTKDGFPDDLSEGDLFIVREYPINEFSLIKTNDQDIFHGIKKP